jgi:hypothetical protein
MPSTYALGGSPLGLINVKSRPERTGVSSFNAGKTRNIDVFRYNRGAVQPTNVEFNGKVGYAPSSLFSQAGFPNFWPNADIGKVGTEEHDKVSGIKSDKEGKNLPQKPLKAGSPGRGINSALHNDASYDTSLLNILERLSKTKSAALKPQDFAYCKYLGVYPNNRLMIARRFSAPTNNIYGKSGNTPKAVLISWKPETEDFLEISFGEEWIDSDADFTNVLNKLGKDFGIDNAGQGLSKALNIIPLPGFTELLQRQILVEMGVLSSTGQQLPSGNPNLIKISKRRKTIGAGEAGSGLKCIISVKMDCEYEQKFISGIDPTTAWMDILNNIMIFGTSNSAKYNLSGKFEQNIAKWMDNPGTLVKQVIKAVTDAVNQVFTFIEDGAKKALKMLDDMIKPPEKEDTRTEKEKEKDLLKENEEQKKRNESNINGVKNTLTKFFKDLLASAYATISKYKVEIMGIANSLSGSPSTPWHITLGNPLRPFFSSGDMYISQDVTIKFGSALAFNDLPSSIKVGFTLQNARPLGMEEILSKFNMGSLRTVNVKKDFVEKDLPTSDGKKNKTEAEKQAFDTLIANSLEQKGEEYFDGIFDKDGDLINPEPKKDAGSPSVTPTETTVIGPTKEEIAARDAASERNKDVLREFGTNEEILYLDANGQTVSSIVQEDPFGIGAPTLNVLSNQDENSNSQQTTKDEGDVVAPLTDEERVNPFGV